MKISLITATYNSSETLPHTLDSLQHQDYRNFETVFIDGGSGDATLEIIQGFRNKDMIVSSEPDGGIYDALNKGMRIATGDILGLLHSDDVFSDRTVLSHVEEAFREGSADIVYGDLLYVSRNNPDKIIRRWKSGDFNISKLKYGWMPPHPTVFFTRKVYEKHGDYNLNYTVSSDYDYLLRILKDLTLKVVYLPIYITSMKMGGQSNRNIRNILVKMKEDRHIIRMNGVGGLFTLICKNIRKVNQFAGFFTNKA